MDFYIKYNLQCIFIVKIISNEFYNKIISNGFLL